MDNYYDQEFLSYSIQPPFLETDFKRKKNKKWEYIRFCNMRKLN